MTNISSNFSAPNPIQQMLLDKTTKLSKTIDPKASSSGEIRQVALKLEGLFLSQMLGHMFKGIKTDGLTGGGNGEAIFRDLLIQEYGSAISKSSGIGLANSIERQLLEMQEAK
ncbi:rod-binding protein [Rhodospirillaceae bacterium]|jgi:Rod binding domain-containing protein|nr:rod-binding protein [Alphaproteobacteria bacterium]MDC1442348.1 rod-binding protein [Rhodospirillaceae bacterium]